MQAVAETERDVGVAARCRSESASAYSRSSRFAAAVSRSTREPFGIVHAVRGDVVGEHPTLVLRRRPVAQRLLDRARESSTGRRAPSATRPGLRWKSTAAFGEQLGERLGAGRTDQRRETDHLTIGEAGGDAVVVGDRRPRTAWRRSRRRDARACRRGARPNTRRSCPSPRSRGRGCTAASSSRSSVASIQCRSMLRSAAGTPSNSMITFMGRIAENSSTKSPPPFSTQRLEALDRRRAHERLELGDRPGRERAADELALHVVVGRVHEDHHGKQRARVERLDRRAFGRAVEQRLLRRLEHVGVAGERVEAELVVAVARLVVAQPAIDRIRILVELVRERVQLHARIVSREDAAMKPDIWLVRHGADRMERFRSPHEPHRRAPDRRRTGAPRSALAPVLAAHEFALVLASPASRALDTARLAGFADAVVDADLRERDYGDVEGRTTAEIRERGPEWADWTVWSGAVPGGETLAEVGARAASGARPRPTPPRATCSCSGTGTSSASSPRWRSISTRGSASGSCWIRRRCRSSGPSTSCERSASGIATTPRRATRSRHPAARRSRRRAPAAAPAVRPESRGTRERPPAPPRTMAGRATSRMLASLSSRRPVSPPIEPSSPGTDAGDGTQGHVRCSLRSGLSGY